MNILITGAAGFIGMHLSNRLLEKGHQVIGIDNLNDYYDPALKYARLNKLGIAKNLIKFHNPVLSDQYSNFTFIKEDICNRKKIEQLFSKYHFDQVFHLAAQAGVQYSLQNPDSYIHCNINGFYQILDACRRFKVDHLFFASSSSVYGMNKKYPYATSDQTDQPASLYAATKKANELMAYSYAHTHHLRTTALRFFTVYGPWGRPDMAPYLFTDAILNHRPLQLNNRGEMWRDFTYIDDIVNGILLVAEKYPADKEEFFHVYNIGNSNPSSILELVGIIESVTGNHSPKILSDLPKGDVLCTYADIDPMINEYGYCPQVGLEEGMEHFIHWYNQYSNKNKG
ncbi:MAG: NAD-dependent epimerase/dehydratase family protein [Bacteroidales bacterium]